MKKKLIISVSFLVILIVFLSSYKKQQDKIVLQFASWGSKSEIELVKPMLSEYEKQNPEIKIDFMHIPQNYFQKIHLLFASNLAPDIVFLNNLYLPIYADAGVLEDLSSFDTKPFYQKALDSLSYKGKLYAIPRDVSNLVIYYNKDIFDKYNVAYPYKKWTMQDFLITCKKLTKDTNSDGNTDIWGVSFEEEPILFYLPYLMSEGGGILSDDLKTQIIDSSKSKKGLNFYADLRNKYNVAPKKSESASATMAQLFLQGRLAMQLSGRWLVPKYREEAKFDWDVINFPNGTYGSIVPMDASGWALSKSSKHKKEALKLIEFLSSYQNLQKLTKSGLIVPARNDVAKGEFSPQNIRGKNSPFKKPRHEEVFIEVIKTSKPTPVSANYREIQDEIKKKNDYLFNSSK